MQSQPPRRCIGREQEFEIVSSEIESSRRASVCRVTAIIGAPGIGKSLLQQVIANHLSGQGWLVWHASCYEAQQNRPFAAFERLVAAGLSTMEPSTRERYVSGLEAGLAALGPSVHRVLQSGTLSESATPEVAERAVLRLLDGLLLDYSVLVTVDDTQWIDAESARLIKYLLERYAASSLYLLIAERSNVESPLRSVKRDRDLLLGPLDSEASEHLVRSVYADANNDVIQAIVAYSAGIPLTILANATQAARDRVTKPLQVGQSIATICRRDLLALDQNERGILQLCALLQQPIEYRILRALFASEAEAVREISRLLSSYLQVHDRMFNFVHAEVLKAVTDTVVLSVPLHKHLLDSLLSIVDGEIEIMRRVVYHARASGENKVERRVLVELGETFVRHSNWDEAIAAFERAVEISEPNIEHHIEFYANYSTALRAKLRIAECHRVLERAMRRAEELGLTKGLGTLVNGLILTSIIVHDYSSAELAYRQMSPLLANEAEQLDLAALMMAVYAYQGRMDSLQQFRAEIALKSNRLSNSGATFLTMAEGVAFVRSGDSLQAARVLRIGKLRAESRKSFQTGAIDIQLIMNALFNESRDHGVECLHAFKRQYGKVNSDVISLPTMFVDFIAGDWESVHAALEDSPVSSERGLLVDHVVVELMMKAFRRELPPITDTTLALSRREFREGRTGSAVLLGAWSAASSGKCLPDDLEFILSNYERLPGRGILPWSLIFGATALLGLALYAVQANDKRALSWIADAPEPEDQSVWWRANYLVARGLARMRSSRAKQHSSESDEGLSLFRSLGAVSVAAFIAERTGQASRDDLLLLQHIGVPCSSSTDLRSSGRGSKTVQTLSKREWQVSELVAAGETNREIAAKLFLSERTVEAHLASAFRKLDISSRTQLTRWFVLQ